MSSQKLTTKPLSPPPNANPPMSLTIDTHFAHLSSALDTLIKSLSTYNPTPSHAQNLVTADAELNTGLASLHTHQTNHSTLLALRAQSAELDTQIKDTLLLLTTTRSEVLNTPSTPLAPTNPVSYSELLSYARRISRTTLPQSYREPTAPQPVVQEESSNGTSTPAHPSSTPNLGGAVTNGVEAGKGEHSTKLPQQFDMATTLPEGVFTPWPQDMLLRRGALATIQVLMERGEGLEGEGRGDVLGIGENVAPTGEVGFGGEESAGAVGVGGAVQQHQQQQRPAGVQPKKKAAFELETFEDDDEEDD